MWRIPTGERFAGRGSWCVSCALRPSGDGTPMHASATCLDGLLRVHPAARGPGWNTCANAGALPGPRGDVGSCTRCRADSGRAPEQRRRRGDVRVDGARDALRRHSRDSAPQEGSPVRIGGPRRASSLVGRSIPPHGEPARTEVPQPSDSCSGSVLGPVAQAVASTTISTRRFRASPTASVASLTGRVSA